MVLLHRGQSLGVSCASTMIGLHHRPGAPVTNTKGQAYANAKLLEDESLYGLFFYGCLSIRQLCLPLIDTPSIASAR